MRILLKAGDVLLGHIDTESAKTDPPMGCGEAPFQPSVQYSIAEKIFRKQTEYTGLIGPRDEAGLSAIKEVLSSLNLLLVTDAGEAVNVEGFAIADYRVELPDEPLTFQFFGMPYEQFERLFPGHYAAYESSFTKA